MLKFSEAERVLEDAGMVQGLPVSEVRSRLQTGVELVDAGERLLAFFLHEMEVRRLYQETGHGSTRHYAESVLDVDRRRTGELIRIGRELLDLRSIDVAFCRREIRWSKVRELVKVATPKHEEAWLARARTLPIQKLRLEVQLAKPGQPPREDGKMRGLPEVRFPVRAKVGPLVHEKLELARQKLTAERGGEPLSDAECLEIFADMVLGTDEKGDVPGRKKVDSSLYRVVLHARAEDPEGPLGVDSPLGLCPVEGSEGVEEGDALAFALSEAIRCDAGVDVAPGEAIDARRYGLLHPPTPSPLRKRCARRDHLCCRNCGSRRGLMVHHVVWRSRGGATEMGNLVCLCSLCHSLVHAGLLFIEGKDASKELRFRDREGRGVSGPGRFADPSRLLRLRPPRPNEGSEEAASPAPRALFLDDLPEEIDRLWWRRVGHLFRFRGEKGLELRPGAPLPESEVEGEEPERRERPDVGFREALSGLVGRDALLGRLDAFSRGSDERHKAFPHTLLSGPPGTGKTTLARGIAMVRGSRLHFTTGPILKDFESLLRLLAGIREGDILFLDEIHAVPEPVLETLYEAMSGGAIPLQVHHGARTRLVRLVLPRFTLIGATTEEGRLSEPLLSRFGIRERLDFSGNEELSALISSAAGAQGLGMEEGVAARLALCSRGTPREALRLLERVMDMAASKGVRALSGTFAGQALRDLGYDRDGLGPLERRYLSVLRRSDHPVSFGRMVRLLGTDAETLARQVEPELFRRGLLLITPRGRRARERRRLAG